MDDLLIDEGKLGNSGTIDGLTFWRWLFRQARGQILDPSAPCASYPQFVFLGWLTTWSVTICILSQIATSAAGLYNLSLGNGTFYTIPPLDEQTEIIKQLNAARTVLNPFFPYNG